MMNLGLPAEDAVAQFTILVAIGFAMQLTLERTRVPVLVGLLIAGMLIGPGGLGVLPRGDVVELFGSLGLLYIMFAAGLEIDLHVVAHHKREAAGFGLAAFAFSFVPVFAVAQWIGLDLTGSVLLGAALSSHTLLSYPLIRKLGLLDRKPIVAIIGGTLVTDSLALLLLVIFLGQDADGGTLAWAGPLLLLGLIAGLALLFLARLAGRIFEARITRPEKALFVVAALMVLASLTEAVGTESILGAFLAGVCLNRPVKRREDLKEHVEFVGRMLFIPFFFIETGMRLDLEIFVSDWSVWAASSLLLASILLGKSTAAFLIGRLFGYSQLERVAMVGLSIPQAAATLAITITALEAGLFDDFLLDAVVVLIFLTCLVGPVLTRYAGIRLSERERPEEERGEQTF